MSNPSPITLAIAAALESAITPVVSALLQPVTERLEKLEEISSLRGEDFDNAVMNVLRKNPEGVADVLEDAIQAAVSSEVGDTVGDKVSEALRRGSFNVEFSPY